MRVQIASAVVVVALVGCDGPTPAPTPLPAPVAPPSIPVSVPEPQTDPLEYVERPAVASAILRFTNEHRARGGTCGTEQMPAVGTVTWDDRLARAAERHAMDMAVNDEIGHTGTDGSTPTDRARDAGYPGVVGENASFGVDPADSDSVAEGRERVEGWIWSEEHCRNLFNPRWRHMGASYVEVTGGEPNEVLWRTHAIQVLGR